MRRNLINNWTDIPLVSNFDYCPMTFNPPVINFSLLQWRQRSMGEVVAGGAIYDSLDVQMKHYLHQFTLSSLKHDPNLENLGTADDVHYQQYDVAMQNSNTATLLNMQNAFSTEDFDTASLYIAQLPSSDTLLQWNKTVANIYTQSRLQDTVINVTDSITLHSIACMNPLETGSAVYFARAILDWNGCEYLPVQQVPRNENEQPLNNLFSSIYPNPTTGKFNIQSGKLMKKITAHDLMGKVILDISINNTVYTQESNFERGVYIVVITLNDGTQEEHKLVVQ